MLYEVITVGRLTTGNAACQAETKSRSSCRFCSIRARISARGNPSERCLSSAFSKGSTCKPAATTCSVGIASAPPRKARNNEAIALSWQCKGQPGRDSALTVLPPQIRITSYNVCYTKLLRHDWAAKLPADVVFKRIALPGSPFYALMSKLYYTLEATGDVDRLDSAVFNAIHGKGLKLIDAKSITTFV